MKSAFRKSVEFFALGCLGSFFLMAGPILDAVIRH